MVEVCQHHSELAESVGEIRGTINQIYNQQKDMASDIKKLKESLVATNTDAAIERTKIRPLYWVAGAFGLAIFNVLTAIVVAAMVNK